MNLLENLSKIKIINKVNLLQEEIEKLKPISKEQEQRIFQKYRLDWNFHSTAIEGNSLNYGETVTFIMHGLTAKGKPLKDHLDIKGHNNAIDFMLSIIKEPEMFTEKDIRELHQLILVEPYESPAKTIDGLPTKKLINIGTYKTSPNHVKTLTGQIHYYATPEETPALMKDLMDWLLENYNNPKIHPIVLSGLFHHKFVEIHPFDDGNGRMARLVMNLILMQKQYPPIIIKNELRNVYYSALSQADSKNPLPFIEFLAENMINSLNIYLKGSKGESLAELDDFDKKMTLFKKQMNNDYVNLKKIKSVETINLLFENNLFPLIKYIDTKLDKLKDLFFKYNVTVANIEGDKWFYNKKISTIENIFDYINNLNSKSELSWVLLVFQFSDFKNKDNSFDIEMKVLINFYKFQYKISYYSSCKNELFDKISSDFFIIENKTLVNNYYHQNFEKEELLSFSNIIALDTLNYTEKKYKNIDFSTIKFNDNILKQILNKYISTLENEIIKKNMLDAKLTFNNNSFILVVEFNSDVEIDKKDFAKFIHKELNLDFNFNFDDLPF